jgi:SAM-dependent methyltransferase
MAGEGQVSVGRSERGAPIHTTLREAWTEEADRWVVWARSEEHDSYWRFHRRRFLDLLPPPGTLTIDMGCGEGRLSRDLTALGHTVVGFDVSPGAVAAAGAVGGAPPGFVGDAAFAPVRGSVADLVIGFMSPQDMDDVEGALAEAARVLVPGGRLCLALVHPVNSSGRFEGDRTDAGRPFVIRGSYFERRRYRDEVERDGLEIAFTSEHRSLQDWFGAVTGAGFVVEDLREIGADDPADKWDRLPLFLHLRARLDRDDPSGTSTGSAA